MKKKFGTFFVSKELLYSTDPELIKRFISPAPFSKFYLNIDVDSPGQIGQWLGLQIVKAYQMKERKSIVELSILLTENYLKNQNINLEDDEKDEYHYRCHP